MIFDRRRFIVGAVIVAGTPVLGSFLSLSSSAQSTAACPSIPSPTQTAGAVTDPTSVLFKIQGWSLPEAQSADQGAYEVLININQSWRTAWR